MRKVETVTPRDGFELRLTFDDGVKGAVDLSRHAGCGVFSAWNDPEYFRSVRVGERGELIWGDDIDMCPDALYLEVTGKTPEELFPNLSQ